MSFLIGLTHVVRNSGGTGPNEKDVILIGQTLYRPNIDYTDPHEGCHSYRTDTPPYVQLTGQARMKYVILIG